MCRGVSGSREVGWVVWLVCADWLDWPETLAALAWVAGVEAAARLALAAEQICSPASPRRVPDSVARLRRRAGSPMSRAASARTSMEGRSGGISRNSGAIFHFCWQRILVRTWVLRELLSSAMLRAFSSGTLETRSRLRTRVLLAMARSGRMTRSSMRWYSMAGMMATSAAPVRRASAHCDGTVKERSYLPLRGPLVKPQTSGAVFRYLTIEMRSFGKLVVFPGDVPMFAPFGEGIV